jgi:hypothetical protein
MLLLFKPTYNKGNQGAVPEGSLKKGELNLDGMFSHMSLANTLKQPVFQEILARRSVQPHLPKGSLIVVYVWN